MLFILENKQPITRWRFAAKIQIVITFTLQCYISSSNSTLEFRLKKKKVVYFLKTLKTVEAIKKVHHTHSPRCRIFFKVAFVAAFNSNFMIYFSFYNIKVF